jgi:hypothetical protein
MGIHVATSTYTSLARKSYEATSAMVEARNCSGGLPQSQGSVNKEWGSVQVSSYALQSINT